MRFPAFKVYRAFPELDRFSDEQCKGFVKAGARGLVAIIFREVTLLLASLGVFVAVLAGAILVGEHFRIGPTSSRSEWVVRLVTLVQLLLAFGAAGLAWLLGSDWLLRRRIRRVIRTRGSCAACGYVLAGLPVSESLVVKCPECEFELVADVSLGEVVQDTSGRARFLPSPDAVPLLRRWFTPERRRVLKRVVLWGSVAAATLGALGWGGYEWFLRWQASKAAADRTGFAGLMAASEALQPEGTTPDSPDAWDAFQAAVVGMARVDIQVTRESGVEYPPDLRPEYSYDSVYLPDDAYGSGADGSEKAAVARDLARKLIAAYRSAGVFKTLDEMAGRKRAVRQLHDPGPGTPLIALWPPDHRAARYVARLNGARMRLASDAGDLNEYESALEANLAAVRMLNQSPVFIDRIVSFAIEALSRERVRELLASHPGVPWLDATERAIERQRSRVTLADAIRLEERVAQDSVAWLFSDSSRARGGRFGSGIRSLGGLVGARELPDRPLGTYEQNRSAIEARFGAVCRLVREEPFERPGGTGLPDFDLSLLELLCGGLHFSIGSSDQERLGERGLRLLIALERFRCEHGEYPERLEELVPRGIDALPLDPFSGKPFCYRRVPGEGGGPGSFLAYSVGADGVDNGGVSARNPIDATHAGTSGVDFVIGPGGTDYSR